MHSRIAANELDMNNTPWQCLVTGATGFIGQNLCKTLRAQGHTVYGCYHSPGGKSKLEKQGIIPVQLDLEAIGKNGVSQEQFPEVDCVFHLAGKLSGPFDEMARVNGQATEKLAQHFSQQAKPPRFVYISSVAAGGPSTRTEPKLESDLPNPISDYGKSKLLGEQAVSKFASLMNVTIVRPGIVFGDGDREFIQILNTMHAFKWCPAIATADQPLAFIEVQDLVRLIIAAAIKGETVPSDASMAAAATRGMGIYYAADSAPFSLNRVRELYIRATGRNVSGYALPKPLGWALGGIAEGGSRLFRFKTTLSRDKIREATTPGWWANAAKAERQLGWSPKYSIEETMERLIRTRFPQSKARAAIPAPSHQRVPTS